MVNSFKINEAVIMGTNPLQLLKSERKILDILSYGQSYSQKEIVKLTEMQDYNCKKSSK